MDGPEPVASPDGIIVEIDSLDPVKYSRTEVWLSMIMYAC